MNDEQEDNTSKDDTVQAVESKGKSNVQLKSKDIAEYQSNNSISSINLFEEKGLAAAEALLGRVIKSSKGGITSVADGLAVLMRANDLGLPFSTCIEHIHVINGKTGIDIHIVKALLSRAGCTWDKVKDYQPLYEYTDGINVYNDGDFPDYVRRCKSKEEADALTAENKDTNIYYAYPVLWYKDFKGNVYRDYQIVPDKMGIVINKAQIDFVTKQNKVPITRVPSVPIDYVTEYKITRYKNGKEISATGRFSYNDAVQADLLGKDTYAKYAKVLIGHRAFTYAAREVASDILFGVMETTELKIMNDVNLSAKDFDGVEEAGYEVID